jgi:hypothetical protein
MQFWFNLLERDDRIFNQSPKQQSLYSQFHKQIAGGQPVVV